MSETGYRVGDLFVDDDGYVCFRIRILGSLAPGIYMTLHGVGWQAFPDRNDTAEPYWTGTHAYPARAGIEDIVATYMEKMR